MSLMICLFEGLKILRCCDYCDIVGAIKGEKKFKKAHWHCYKCRNGFNRRDEAIKHYKTHFRNPQTTFQIQISQVTFIQRRLHQKLVIIEQKSIQDWNNDDLFLEKINDGQYFLPFNLKQSRLINSRLQPFICDLYCFEAATYCVDTTFL